MSRLELFGWGVVLALSVAVAFNPWLLLIPYFGLLAVAVFARLSFRRF